jgi:DNA-binding response OmpR family regulator
MQALDLDYTANERASRGTILILQDSDVIAEELREVMGEEGFRGVHVRHALDGVDAFRGMRPIGVLLDWVLPGGSGLEVCRQIRGQDPLVPIIFISSRDDEPSVTRALDSGADDFVVRPFRSRELVARLEASLRKTAAARAAATAPTIPTSTGRLFHVGEVQVDLAAREVQVDGDEVVLGPLEFKLLEYFCGNAGIALSREQILSQVYGYEADISTERVDLLVRRLRAKLGEGPDRGGQLVAVPGYGYRLERRRVERF